MFFTGTSKVKRQKRYLKHPESDVHPQTRIQTVKSQIHLLQRRKNHKKSWILVWKCWSWLLYYIRNKVFLAVLPGVCHSVVFLFLYSLYNFHE